MLNRLGKSTLDKDEQGVKYYGTMKMIRDKSSDIIIVPEGSVMKPATLHDKLSPANTALSIVTID